MTETELLQALYNDMQAMKADMQAMKADMQAMKADMQAMKADMQAMKADMQTMKGDIQSLKVEMESVKADMQVMKGDIQSLKDEMHQVKERLTRLELKLENETNHNLQLLAENHISLVDKLNDAMRVQNKAILYEVQVSDLRSRVDTLEREVSELKSKIA